MIFSHRDRNKAYNFIYSKFHDKFGTVKANKLNHAGRLQYINLVLSSIPVYYMSTVLFSKSFIAKINAIIRKFWWACIQAENPSNPITYRSWDDICKPKDQGGLGIGDMDLINKSLIIQTTWNVITDKNLSYLIFLRLSTISTHLFWTTSTPGPRLVFRSSSNIYMTAQFYRFMQGTPQFGLHHGYLPRPPFMITYFCLSLTSPCLPLFLICGCREHNNGIKTFLLPPSLPKLCKPSTIPLLCLPHPKTFSDGDQLLMENAHPKPHTLICNSNSITPYPQPAPEPSLLKPIPFSKKSGRGKQFLPFSKPLPIAFSGMP
jgi:hypothetical protein